MLMAFIALRYVQRITEARNHVVITDRMWARLLSSTNQPSFLQAKEIAEARKEQPSTRNPLNGTNSTQSE